MTSYQSAPGTSVTDPHNLDADLNPDPPFNFEADPTPIYHIESESNLSL
jgi:hypothetical protein